MLYLLRVKFPRCGWEDRHRNMFRHSVPGTGHGEEIWEKGEGGLAMSCVLQPAPTVQCSLFISIHRMTNRQLGGATVALVATTTTTTSRKPSLVHTMLFHNRGTMNDNRRSMKSTNRSHNTENWTALGSFARRKVVLFFFSPRGGGVDGRSWWRHHRTYAGSTKERV